MSAERARLLTPDVVATWLHISRGQVQELARSRELPAPKIGRYWRFEEGAIRRHLDERRRPA
ncbi:helix-turn-helix domain-containing protein [Microbacterium sp. 13-71-7]|uniref:helix-turn-helix domain-containing protein n=1 Tax=Microbacterium sp. 13-71-7 TaxID=1970399 RepID=UPI00345066EF